MRTTAQANGVSAKAYAGTTGVLLAMNVSARARRGLLGFALERRVGPGGEPEWLTSMLAFPGMPHAPGDPIPTKDAPVQKFRWSDYRVYPNTEYEYTVHPVYGEPGRPRVQPGPSVQVRTAGTEEREHVVLFNRAAAASQAFSRKFPDVEKALDAARRAGRPPPPLPPEALDWLSRGVLEQIVGFVDRAVDASWALDIAICEYELGEIVAAVEAAHRRGVNVRVVYHAKPGDPQTAENERHLAGLPPAVKRRRVTQKICHHKFIVLSRIEGGGRRPVAVLCGSTNFTENGVYRQANVVHVVGRSAAAEKYLELFEVLFGGSTPVQTRAFVDSTDPIDTQAPLYLGFSPRSNRADLRAFVAEVKAAGRDVLFCTAFDLYDGLEEALLGLPHDPILRLGLQNSRSKITGFHRDRTANFSATAMLSRGLEGFLKESTKGQRGNILIHTKLIVIDFTSEAPTVISGSHNLSISASEGNDENFLVLRGNADVADCYGVELMRLYDHYRFRWAMREQKQALTLAEDDSWTARYFERGSLHRRDRISFGVPVR